MARVYDTSVLHRIDIVIALADARTILNRTTERARCTLTFDGVVLVDRILATAPDTTRAAADVKRFADCRPVIESFVNDGGTTSRGRL